jgi:hypothetical protein
VSRIRPSIVPGRIVCLRVFQQAHAISLDKRCPSSSRKSVFRKRARIKPEALISYFDIVGSAHRCQPHRIFFIHRAYATGQTGNTARRGWSEAIPERISIYRGYLF